MMPNRPCSGANDTEAPPTRARPGDSRRSSWLSNFDGMPYGLVATGWPSVVLQVGRFRMSGSPSLALAQEIAPSGANGLDLFFRQEVLRSVPQAPRLLCTINHQLNPSVVGFSVCFRIPRHPARRPGLGLPPRC